MHERVGGEIVQVAPRSMLIEAPVADWEEWTEMLFPDDGTYVVPGMLAPLEVRDGVGTHVEPNVWMRHSVCPRPAVHRPVTTVHRPGGHGNRASLATLVA